MHINRNELLFLFSAFAQIGSGVVIGPPGIGKTSLLKEFCKRISTDQACLYIPIDKIGVDTEEDLVKQLEMPFNFIKTLQEESVQNPDSRGYLVFDGFDAARSEQRQRLYLGLIRRVIQQLAETWTVIVSVRTYDAKRSQELLELFPRVRGDLTPVLYLDRDVRCRHFVIPRLTPEEVRIALLETTFVEHYDRTTHELKELLRTPFHLWLFTKSVEQSLETDNTSTFRSEIELLTRFWQQRITQGPNGDAARAFLTRITRLMVANRSLSLRIEDSFSTGDEEIWALLRSREVLIETGSSGQRILYAHNILFDFAVSILLMEDDAENLAAFILDDASRPLFLRPSINYYFLRLWYWNRALFWRNYWKLLENTNPRLQLLLRVMPPSIMVKEFIDPNDLEPLLIELDTGSTISIRAISHLLQAVRALQLTSDELWIPTLTRIANAVHTDFAFDLVRITSDRLDRALQLQEIEVVTQIGKIARHLFNWTQDHEGLNPSFAAMWLVPMMVRTASTAPAESIRFLEPLLELVKHPNFEIGYISRLCYDVSYLWTDFPEFVKQLYVVVFSHTEISQDITSFGGSIVRLTSNRKQDFESCRYSLGTAFPNFLKAKPREAITAGILALNGIIFEQHVRPYRQELQSLEEISQHFQFLDRTAIYVPDGSYVWDSEHSRYHNTPIQMADQLFVFLRELVNSPSTLQQAQSLLDVFRDNAQVAFLWKRLLILGIQSPQHFGVLLFELASSRVLQTSSETRYEVGRFIANVTSEMSQEQRLELEGNLVSLPLNPAKPEVVPRLERVRSRLLSEFPRHLLQTQDAKDVLKQLEDAEELVENRPAVLFTHHEGPSPEELALREKRDREHQGNFELKRLVAPLVQFKTDKLNEIPSADDVSTILPLARQLNEALQSVDNADEDTRNTTYVELVDAVSILSRGVITISEEAYAFCRSILLTAAQHEEPKYDPKYHERYDFASWSSTPRNCAALGLPWLGRLGLDIELSDAIEKLIHDPVPSVRFCGTSEIWRMYNLAPKTVLGWCFSIAQNERNGVVQDALSTVLGNIGVHEQELSNVMKILATQDFELQGHSNLRGPIAELTTWLAISQNDVWAKEFLEQAMQDPAQKAKLLKQVTHDALRYVIPPNLDRARSPEILSRGLQFIVQIITAVEFGLEQLKNEMRGSKTLSDTKLR